MTDKEAMKLALEALEESLYATTAKSQFLAFEAITALKERLAQPEQEPAAVWELFEDGWDSIADPEWMESLPIGTKLYTHPPQRTEQEPVAWLITDEKINSLQVDSIQRLIDRARHAHMTDIKLRINGQDEWFQADWLKHLTRTTPPQRTEQSGWRKIQIDDAEEEAWRELEKKNG